MDTEDCTYTLLNLQGFTSSRDEITMNGTAMPYISKSCSVPPVSFSIPSLYGSYTTGINSAWQIIFGNITGKLVLKKGNSTELYSWNWTTYGRVYAKRASDSINWQSLYDIGRTTFEIASSDDFAELDSVLGTGAYADNITATYSSDGSAPLRTYSATVYGRSIPYVPIANSSPLATPFLTGILWDSTADFDDQYDLSENENLVFFTELNGTRQGAYGNYTYELRVPSTFDTYKGYSTVELWLELQ
jgi:hypothetical protein